MIILKRPKILLVEDNPNDAELIKLSLQLQFIKNELVIVQDGEAAIAYLSDSLNLPLPDLILLDLYLPKVSGLEVLKHIRETPLTKTLPVIIFTSSEEQNDFLASYNSGANACIRKGLEPSEFKTALKNLEVFWLMKN